jgi:hypothetical protein
LTKGNLTENNEIPCDWGKQALVSTALLIAGFDAVTDPPGSASRGTVAEAGF